MLKLDQKAINQCVRCGACRTVCPVFQESGWESANTRGADYDVERHNYLSLSRSSGSG